MIGKGSTATVFKSGRYVSKSYGTIFDLVKVLRELHILRFYKHTNIIKFYYHKIDNDGLRFKLEYGGLSLGSLKGESNIQQRLDIVIPDILSALEFLHINGICHRDVSPFNILCRKRAKLCDFSSCIKASSYTKKITNTWFDSPDTIKTCLSDIYSFGVSILYYTGRTVHSYNNIIRKCLDNERPTATILLNELGIVNEVGMIDTDPIPALLSDDVALTYDDFMIFKRTCSQDKPQT